MVTEKAISTIVSYSVQPRTIISSHPPKAVGCIVAPGFAEPEESNAEAGQQPLLLQQSETKEDPVGAALVRLAQGDRKALERVYRLTSGALLGVAVRILRDRESAEEVLQESFVQVWRKVDQYAPDKGSGFTWIATIVRNRSIDRLRAQQRERQHVDRSESLEDLEIPTFADDLEVSRDDTRTLMACVQKLGENYRQAILLAYYYGLTHEELASRMDAPLGTVKSWVRRGLMQLKACLETEDHA